jgi:hypothetical protein
LVEVEYFVPVGMCIAWTVAPTNTSFFSFFTIPEIEDEVTCPNPTKVDTERRSDKITFFILVFVLLKKLFVV